MDRESTFGAYEAKTHFSEILDRAENGEEITITRHGQPVAKLIPTKRRATPEQVRATFVRMAEIARHMPRLSQATLKEYRERGRR